MKIKCAVFDFDGTLFDSMYIWDNVAHTYLRSLGKTPTSTLREDVRALSLYQSACYFKKDYDLSLSAEEIVTGINKIIERYYLHEVLPKAGVVEFLEQLKNSGVTMCIATATDRYLIESALKRCKMEHYFDAIFTCGEVGHGKDEPVIFRKAMESFDADLVETLVFEDALHAVCTAKADEFTVIAVADDSEMRQSEIYKLSDFYIESFENTEAFWNFIKAF